MKKFRIYKTSDSWYGFEKPCEEAYIDKTEEDYGETRNFWAIDVSSLKELMNIIEKIGHCVVISSACDYTDNLPSIEIYDDYRE